MSDPTVNAGDTVVLLPERTPWSRTIEWTDGLQLLYCICFTTTVGATEAVTPVTTGVLVVAVEVVTEE